MKKRTKGKIRRLINIEEKDGLEKSINRLKKRYNYLLSKNFKSESNQQKYLKYHIRKLERQQHGA
ncbi:MAG: hypothetical protein ACYSOO_09990 [Planctomycetota bacterium]|jgi:hypothetical protein